MKNFILLLLAFALCIAYSNAAPAPKKDFATILRECSQEANSKNIHQIQVQTTATFTSMTTDQLPGHFKKCVTERWKGTR
uniref:Putative maxadilan n=1 Tax=Nyssomyia neivai TaxID=330878 RepID=A0A1L8DPS4_9DIPT